ncbi:MAG: ATP-binding cassette domain-containing protein [Pseudobutyrivibrio sp.]|nr:ATP-binding cassette domain-containing protein [Pseudobutyrivibrio sp.]
MYEIEIKNLTKTFEDKVTRVDAITDISLNIEKGDIFGIIGMSGAGKSTLIRCLNYLERPTSGQVIIEGKELGSLSEKELRKERQEIAMIFQHFNLLQQKSVVENVMFPLILQGVKKAEAKAKAVSLLEKVGLDDKAKAYPSQLSGGQQQRVAIARALATNPKILLCDEATSALDPQTTASILALLKRINKEYGITIVLITHQMSVVKAICNKVAVLEEGQLVDSGKLGEVNLPEDKFFWIDGDSRPTGRQSQKLNIEEVEVDGYVG